MEIFFRTKSLQKIGCDKNKAIKLLGQQCADKLHKRLNELRAMDCLEDVRYMSHHRCHELHNDRKGQLSIDLKHPLRLIFIPANDPVPCKADGGLDWSGITQIEVIEIADTH